MSSVSTSMTTMATETPTARLRVQGYPADYDIYESNVAPSSNSPQQIETRTRTTTTQTHNPPGWPDDYRRIPPYRPINRHLDQSQRRVYTSLVEQAFINIMFTGLEINVVSGTSLWMVKSYGLAN